MTEAIERFFESLPARAPEVLRGLVSGALQIELFTGGHSEHWLVRMRPGSVEVGRHRGPADAIWYSSADLFDRLVTGRAQGVSAVLRNESTFSGNVVLFLAFRRFFPDPPGTRDPREMARKQTGRLA
ncbi:SCP2 sterol-binding domain-containing protein [Micromonospora sp. URMC 103]|uniref:SCP2 sterol-binding domain-containing protein n=1 Tax=Micromonospora sp. URMC 103 TaxID=3423406 RepID=UPI003F1C101D